MTSPKELAFIFYTFIYLLYVHVEARGQPAGVNPLLPLCRYPELNSGHLHFHPLNKDASSPPKTHTHTQCISAQVLRNKLKGEFNKHVSAQRHTGTMARTVLAGVWRKRTSMKEITCRVFPRPMLWARIQPKPLLVLNLSKDSTRLSYRNRIPPIWQETNQMNVRNITRDHGYTVFLTWE